MLDSVEKIYQPTLFFETPSFEEERQHTFKVMEYVKDHFLAPYQEGRFWNVAYRFLKGRVFRVQRFNHGLAHSLRQGALAKNIFKKLNGLHSVPVDSPELKELAEWASQKDANYLYKIELASSFQRSGRQSEASSSTELEKYKRYELQDAINFRKAAISSGLFADEEEIKIFEEAILWSNKGDLNENFIPDLKYLRRILHCAHTFDLRRIPSFNALRIRKDAMKQLLGKASNSVDCKIFENAMWNLSGIYLKATGDRDLTCRKWLENKFFYQTANPYSLVDAIHKANYPIGPKAYKR